MGIFHFDRSGQIVAFEEKPNDDRLEQIGPSVPTGAVFTTHNADKPYVASMGIYVFSRQVLLDVLRGAGHRFRPRDHPCGAAALQGAGAPAS